MPQDVTSKWNYSPEAPLSEVCKLQIWKKKKKEKVLLLHWLWVSTDTLSQDIRRLSGVGLVLGEIMCKSHDWEFTQWLAKSETTQRARNFTLHIITLSSYTDFGDWILKLWCQSFFESTHEGDLVTVLPLQLPHNKASVTKEKSHFKLLSNISAINRNQQLPGRSGTNLIHWKVANNTV